MADDTEPGASDGRFVSTLVRETLAVILAGGKGKRLGSLTSHRVKPAVPFGGHFRIIHFALSNCVNSGIRRIGVTTQYKAHSLIQDLHQAWGFLRPELGEYLEILPAQQRTGESWYRGTADSIYQNRDILRLHGSKYLLVLGGDHIYKMDYGRMLAAHVNAGADITVGCIPVPVERSSAFGIMEIDDNHRVIRFSEKPEQCDSIPGMPGYALASMGIYVFNTEYIFSRLLVDAADAESGHDFGGDIIPAAVDDSVVHAFSFHHPQTGAPAYWRDVGDLDSYWQANLELVGIDPELDLYDEQWPILSWRRQAPPAKFPLDGEGRPGEAINSLVAGGCIVSGARVENSVVSSYARVGEGSRVEESVILDHARVGRDVRIRRAIVETGCEIPDGTHIGLDPVADAARFEVSRNGIVLVTPEMFGQEVHYIR